MINHRGQADKELHQGTPQKQSGLSTVARGPPPRPLPQCCFSLCPESQLLLELRKHPDWANCIKQIKFWHDNGDFELSLCKPFHFSLDPKLLVFIYKEEHQDLFQLSGACKLLVYYGSPSLKLSWELSPETLTQLLQAGPSSVSTQGQKPNWGASASHTFHPTQKEPGFCFLEYALLTNSEVYKTASSFEKVVGWVIAG